MTYYCRCVFCFNGGIKRGFFRHVVSPEGYYLIFAVRNNIHVYLQQIMLFCKIIVEGTAIIFEYVFEIYTNTMPQINGNNEQNRENFYARVVFSLVFFNKTTKKTRSNPTQTFNLYKKIK